METVTIDGMDEHDFRYAIEDMLRLDQVDEAITRLRVLLEPHVGPGGYLPARFLEVGYSDIEFSGWNRLAERLNGHDRPGYPISAMGVVLADARTLGGPGPSHGKLAPFIKTFYFSDDAYPFTDATREDLLDGYTREGFGWQSDFQATDATLSVKGIDDLHGAIVELEDRLMDSASPPDDAIRAGTIGACYLAALIHRSLRETIRRHGLPRPLCVLAGCDGVYPFFDAPVVGTDEHEAEPAPAVRSTAEDDIPEDVWPSELDDAVAVVAEEGSLLSMTVRRTAKQAVMVLTQEDAEEGHRYTEMALAQSLTPGEAHEPADLLHSHDPHGPARHSAGFGSAFDALLAVPPGFLPETAADWTERGDPGAWEQDEPREVPPEWPEPDRPLEGVQDGPEDTLELDAPLADEPAVYDANAYATRPGGVPGQLAAVTGHELRSRIRPAGMVVRETAWDRIRAALARLIGFIVPR